MSITIQEIADYLDQNEVHYGKDESGTLVMTFVTDNYCDCDDGDKSLLIVISLEESGEYFKCFAPAAFKVTGPNTRAFLEACASIQWHMKLVQFEYDPSDGEVRPIIEFPVEDGTITAKQLLRCIHGLAQIVDDAYPILDKALKMGVVDFSGSKMAESRIENLVENLERMVASGMLSREQADEMARILEHGDDSKGDDSEPPESL